PWPQRRPRRRNPVLTSVSSSGFPTDFRNNAYGSGHRYSNNRRNIRWTDHRGHRNSLAPSSQTEWVDALNLVDVVYSDNQRVKQAWHNLYDYTHNKPMDMRIFHARAVDLLSEMSKAIGYGRLRDSDIDRFYFPEGHGKTAETQGELQ